MDAKTHFLEVFFRCFFRMRFYIDFELFFGGSKLEKSLKTIGFSMVFENQHLGKSRQDRRELPPDARGKHFRLGGVRGGP